MSNLISKELRLFKIRQSFEDQKIDDVVEAIDSQFDAAEFLPDLHGKSVAISAGSRGISKIGLIIKAIASNIKKRGGIPFVVPAMGSHGGGDRRGATQGFIALQYHGRILWL